MIVGVSGYSRWLVARMVPSRATHDVIGGHLDGLRQLGGVPKAGVYDGEAAFSVRRGGRPVLMEAFQAFRGALGMGAVICKPGVPEAKGLVERANRYLETSFLPGRSFGEVEDFNAQLDDWPHHANSRVHRVLRCRQPTASARTAPPCAASPPILPDPAWRFSVRLDRDHHIRVGTCDYSVHPRAIGRRVEVRVDLDRVSVTLVGADVGTHRRSYAKHRTITAPDHVTARDRLRAAAQRPRPVEVDVEQRDLADYDRALGVA